MERNNKGLGVSQFRVKYKETTLQIGPSAISGYLGTLRKGAVMEIIGDDHPYYYRVRLDSGLEGYVYKAAGELTSGLGFGGGVTLSKVNEDISRANNGTVNLKKDDVPAPLPNNPPPSASASANGVAPAVDVRKAIRPAPPAARPARSVASPPTTRSSNNGRSANGSSASYSSSSSGARSSGRTSRAVIVTSGEIAVFSKPGIIGQQVGKLKRGEQASLVDQDSFFFQVALPNGEVGFIPRYAAEAI